MKLSEEMAVRLHRMMWEDMQKELGDNPGPEYRIRFKEDWIHRMFPGGYVVNSCWLCHYAVNDLSGCIECSRCPIKWPMGHCNTDKISYLRSPISEILALPAKNESFDKKAADIHDLSRDIVVGEVAKASGLPVECDIWSHIKAIENKTKENAVVGSYYKYREDLLSKASGIPATSAIDDHVKAIQEKAVQQSTFSKMYCDAKTELAKTSGLPEASAINDHVRAIVNKARDEGYDTAKEYLAECSGVGQNEIIFDHIRAIKEKAVEEYFEKQPAAKLVTMDVDDAFKQYVEEQMDPIFKKLAAESGLDATATVQAHINAIYSNGIDDGKDEERERILDKIGEMLKK